MSKIAHTPEPWSLGKWIDAHEVYIDALAGDPDFKSSMWEGLMTVYGSEDDAIKLSHSKAEANARRVVACVNALQGVSTEKLEEAAKLGITDVSMGNLFSSRLALEKKLREAEQEIAYLNSRLNGGV
jgi:hypothetical protein